MCYAHEGTVAGFPFWTNGPPLLLLDAAGALTKRGAPSLSLRTSRSTQGAGNPLDRLR